MRLGRIVFRQHIIITFLFQKDLNQPSCSKVVINHEDTSRSVERRPTHETQPGRTSFGIARKQLGFDYFAHARTSAPRRCIAIARPTDLEVRLMSERGFSLSRWRELEMSAPRKT